MPWKIRIILFIIKLCNFTYDCGFKIKYKLKLMSRWTALIPAIISISIIAYMWSLDKRLGIVFAAMSILQVMNVALLECYLRWRRMKYKFKKY